MTEQKHVVTSLVSSVAKITDEKLNGSNYYYWNKIVRLYLGSISQESHLTNSPPAEDDPGYSEWVRIDAQLLIQIRNSIEPDHSSHITHSDCVKDAMEELAFVFSGRENISRIFDVCTEFYRAEQHDQSLNTYHMHFKRVYEELNALLPFSADVKVQQAQREQMAIMSFLAGLNS